MALELKDIIAKMADAKTAKTVEERSWDLNQRYLQGQQNLTYDRNLQTYINSREITNVPTINQLLPLYRTVLSKLSAAYPGVVVLPASPSKEDIIKAQASEAALRYYWKAEDISAKVNRVIEYLLLFGNAGWLTYYDPDRDNVCTKAISPFDIFYEAGVANLDDARWVAVRQFYDKEDLIEAYPEHTEAIEKYTASGDSNYTQQQNSYLYSMNYVPPGKVDCYEVYLKNGKYGIMLGNQSYLFEGELPGIFPFQHMKYTDIPNRLWGLSMVTPLIELQSYYNRARGQILMNVELMANPKWLIPKSAGVAPNAITKRAGEKIFYNPAGGTPQQVPAAPIPGYVIDNIRQLQAEMMDVAGIHSTTLGKRATGIISGKAIETLSAQDVSALQTTQDSVEKACQYMAQTVLMMMKTFYTEPKLYRMLDNVGRVIFHQVDSTQIVEDPEIFIEAGSLFQDKAADREARVISLFQAGLIDKDVAMKELQFRTGNAYIVEQLEGMAHANDMLEAVVNGGLIEIFATDDVEAFQQVFGEYMKGRDFYELDPERQDYIRDILIAVSTPNDETGDEVARNMADRMKVFPRSNISTPEEARNLTLLQNSPFAMEQQTGAAVDRLGEQGVADAIQAQEARNVDVASNEALSFNRGAVR